MNLQTRRIQYVVTTRQNLELLLTPFPSILATLTWPPMLVNKVSSTPSLWKLRILGFLESGLILNTCHSVSFTICGDVCRVAQTDVCLLNIRWSCFNVFARQNSI
ncbi:hypothetical protein C8R48DRAFT_682060 [Suillus tomentosus]|nr:hypothetical protein C8R48DRAFT_682060 [Suillus tomentosus]